MSVKGTKHWSDYADNKLRGMYPRYSKAEIMRAFPNRTWVSISQHARVLGVKRSRMFIKATVPTKDPLMESLRYLRQQRNLTAYRLSEMIGLSPKVVARCERGVGSPCLATLTRWCAALGQELTVKPARNANV